MSGLDLIIQPSDISYSRILLIHELIESQFICLPYQSAKKPFFHFTTKKYRNSQFNTEFINWEPNEQSKLFYLIQFFNTKTTMTLHYTFKVYQHIETKKNFFLENHNFSQPQIWNVVKRFKRTHTQYLYSR